MNWTLIRIADSTTKWQPAFALRSESGIIRTRGNSRSDPHWWKVQDVLREMSTNDPYDRVVWEGTVY